MVVHVGDITPTKSGYLLAQATSLSYWKAIGNGRVSNRKRIAMNAIKQHPNPNPITLTY